MARGAIDDLWIPIARDGAATLQAQLAGGLRDAIAAGRIGPGARLPGTRTLAARLGVSRTTAALAIDALVAEGFAVARARSGVFVAALPPRLPGPPPPLAPRSPLGPRASLAPRATLGPRASLGPRSPLAPRAPLATRSPRAPGAPLAPLPTRPPRGVRLARRARALVRGRAPVDRDEPGAARPTAFALSRPALDAFPIETWSRLLSRRAARTSIAQLDYGGGVPALARAIAALVSAARGVRIDPDQVLLVSGGQRAIELAAEALLDPGDRVVVEDPGYPGARHAFVAAGARVTPVPVDRDGLVVAAAPRRARLVYVTPSCQFPTAVTMTAARRAALLAWAARAGACVLEDDYDADFRFAGAPLPALAALDRDGRVVYAGSFSRTLFPAIRLGFLIAPPGLAEPLRRVRAAREDPLPSLTQLALADFIDGGHYVHHLRRMRVLYRARRDALIAAAHAAGLVVRASDAGLHLVCDLPPRRDARAVARAARARGIEAAALASFQQRGRAAPALVLGFGAVPLRRVRGAMSILAAAIAAARPSAT